MLQNLGRNYLELSARKRIEYLFDRGSFRELCPPTEKRISPHLCHFHIPVAFDDGVVAGEATLDSTPVAVIAQEGRFMGGAVGEVHGAKITGMLRRCVETRPKAVIFLIDSGGVRLQEANAGELGISEIIRAALDLRASGIPLLGVVGGSCGAYGGSGIISGCCDALLVSEEGRVGVSGPEVIETNMGVEVFDSRDRALVWRTFGGKNRYLQRQAQEIADNSVEQFRTALIGMLRRDYSYSLAELEQEQAALEARAEKFGACADACEVWRKMGFPEPEKIPSLNTAELKQAEAAK